MALTTTFVGVDADAIGNGDSDETLPVDTWLQNRIQLNNEALLAPRAGICWSPISGSCGTWTSYTGIRPYCAFEWHTVWYGYVQMHRDQTHLNITLAYQSDVPGNTSSAGTVYIGVTCDDGTNTLRDGGTALASTYSSGVKTGHQTITVELAERVRTNRLMRLALWTRSNSTVATVTTIGAGGNGQTSTLYHLHPYRLRESATTGTPGYFDPNSSGSSPDGSSLEAMYVLGGTHPTTNNAAGQQYDLLYTGDNGAQGTLAGTLKAVIPGASAVAGSGTAYVHQCLMLRAVFFDPVFSSATSPVAASAVMDKRRLAPVLTFGSGEAMTQASAVRRAYFQPTVALIGPKGKWHDTAYTEQDLDRFAANGYAAHWPTIRGNFTDGANGDHTDLINEGFWLRTENPTLTLRCVWLSVQHGAPWDQNQVDTGRLEKTGNRNVSQKREVGVSGGPGLARWDMTLSIHQLTDTVSGTGAWATDITEYGALTDTVDIPVYGADVVGDSETQPPVLRGIDSMEQMGKNDTSDPGFWFKEGSLFDMDLGSLRMYETTHTVSLSGLTETETLRPFRIKLNMDLATNGFIDPLKVGLSQAALEDDLRLSLVGFVLIEQPEEP